MKRTVKLAAIFIALAVIIAPAGRPASGFVPEVTTIKVGLYYGNTALASANLQNVDGAGNGYSFGYFDANRAFVPLGAVTGESKITVMRDRNMVYNSGDNSYTASAVGATIVGCYHVILDAAYPSYYEAVVAGEGFDGAFIKYLNGAFYILVGNYSTAEAASAAMASRGLPGTVTSGSSYTVTVVSTGTNHIIFEYDGGGNSSLAVMPVQVPGVMSQTWFKGYRYPGAFEYSRPSGGDLTVLNYVNVEDYVRGLLPYEMGNNWPIEALKAQAVTARTYAAAKLGAHKSSGFDLCTTDHCQVYQGVGAANANTNRAVDETLGLYLTYEGKLCETYYSSSDGGATENVENVWSATIPYLRGVIDPYEADAAPQISKYYWTVTYTPDQITSRLQGKGYNCATIVSMQVTQFTDTGNVLQLTLKDANGRTFNFRKGDALRSTIGVASIRFTVGGAGVPGAVYINSPANTITGAGGAYAVGGDGVTSQLPSGAVYAITGTGAIEAVGETKAGSADGKVDGVFTLSGSGRGHNVGMSQWGAYSMAKFHNKTFDEILHFYYTNVTIG
jgi:stage II sporulation protein D